MKSFLRQLDEAFELYENHLGVHENNYIEVAIRDARFAGEIYADIKRNYENIVTYGSNVYASDNAEELDDLLTVFEQEKIDIISKELNLDLDDELDEQNVTGAVAGYSTPNAFRKKTKKVSYASGIEESINTPPSYKHGKHQRPESMEETAMQKFPFSSDMSKWPNGNQEYPVEFSNHPYGTSNVPDKTEKVSLVAEAMDRKYEQMIEGYRSFANGDPKISPEKKVKSTIQEIAKKLQEIETLVNYNSKLKTESGVTSTAYGPSTSKALTKISERLIKISERVRSLGE
jgi:hypothetical protein